MDKKFDVCFQSGTSEDWEWEVILQTRSYSEAMDHFGNKADIGSGLGIFYNDIRILPKTKTAKKILKQEIADAVETLDFILSSAYCDWLYFASLEEKAELQERFETACIVLRWNNILYNDKMREKRKYRKENRPEEPIRFINRPHFIACEPEELAIWRYPANAIKEDNIWKGGKNNA